MKKIEIELIKAKYLLIGFVFSTTSCYFIYWSAKGF